MYSPSASRGPLVLSLLLSGGPFRASSVMGSDKQIAVAVALTPDLGLLPVLQGLVNRLAEKMGFGESQRFNLQEGVRQACRSLIENWGERGDEEMELKFSGFSDRLEIVVENGEGGAAATGPESFLLNQLLDRVVLEETGEGKSRITLVKYLSRVESQP